MKPRLVAANQERGAVLLITLVMLVILTLFVLSGIRLSNVNLRIIGNYQWQKQMEMMTDSAIEQLVSSSSTFDNTAVQAGTATDQDMCNDGTVVAAGGCTLTNPKIGTVSVPRCTGTSPAVGYTLKLGELTPEDNMWVINAVATDPASGAKVTVYRGVTVRMLSQHCPQ